MEWPGTLVLGPILSRLVLSCLTRWFYPVNMLRWGNGHGPSEFAAGVGVVY